MWNQFETNQKYPQEQSSNNNYFKEYIYDLFDDWIFVQKRYWLNWQIIDVYKIRTMIKDAENNIPQEIKNGLWRPTNDHRLIKSRAWMRKYWIDELPQLINILKWDMNIFGVRPMDETTKSTISASDFALRTKYKPGIFWVYAFYLIWRKSRKHYQKVNIYAKYFDKYKKIWWPKLYKFLARTLVKNFEAIIRWSNR